MDRCSASSPRSTGAGSRGAAEPRTQLGLNLVRGVRADLAARGRDRPRRRRGRPRRRPDRGAGDLRRLHGRVRDRVSQVPPVDRGRLAPRAAGPAAGAQLPSQSQGRRPDECCGRIAARARARAPDKSRDEQSTKILWTLGGVYILGIVVFITCLRHQGAQKRKPSKSSPMTCSNSKPGSTSPGRSTSTRASCTC